MKELGGNFQAQISVIEPSICDCIDTVLRQKLQTAFLFVPSLWRSVSLSPSLPQ